jgi:2-polyprenyl-3-methyl-5-hydroxy-6-metoxy-1,4-benzoquinol methylase
MKPSEKILKSWQQNAANWIATIEQQEIESRRLVTNDAIIQTVCSFGVNKILDVGCGEGWLTRALQQKGMEAVGVDAIPQLVTAAIEKGGPFYEVVSYQDLAKGAWRKQMLFDAAVINFALIDQQDTEALIHALPIYLSAAGFVVIQTLHPYLRIASGDYVTGWKEGSWEGMKRRFTHAYPWYFRTLEDWLKLFQSKYTLVAVQEPMHPETRQPLSIIFILQTKESILS